jgi:hypothetical protein
MKIKNMNSGLVKKVIIIFLIGLVCRVGFNMVYNLDMFKEFGSVVALVSYVTRICSSIVVYELPGVNFSSLNFKVVKQAIREFCREGFGVKQELAMDEGDEHTSTGSQKSEDKLATKEHTLLHRKSSGEHRGRTSAGVTGLYGKPATGRVSAGISGLYGESSRPSTARSDRTEYIVDKERFEDNVRNRNIKKISVNSSKEFGRVSGFKNR